MRDGHTLPELFAVVLLLGLAAAIAMPAYLRPPFVPEPLASANRTTSWFDSVAHDFTRRGIAFQVVIDTDRRTAAVQREDSAGWGTFSSTSLPVAAGVALDAAAPRLILRWDPRGLLAGDSIVLRYAQRQAVVALDPARGRLLAR